MNHRVLVLVGRGRYADPWHDHAATSYEVARLIDDLGPGAGEVDVMVRSSFPEALDDLADVDLLVVNTGSGRRDPEFDGDDARWLPVHQRLEDYARAGGGVLGLHQAAMTFEDSPFWERILGGRWVHGVSGHPPLGDAVVQVRTDAHAITQGLHGVTAVDERYSNLRVSPDVTVLATHVEDGGQHPVAWVNTADGYRAVYDALGHDVTALASPSRRALLRQEVRWLLGLPPRVTDAQRFW